MSFNQIICERCHSETVFPNRVITDSCGHKKCIECLEAESNNCYECLEEMQARNNHCVETESPNLRINPEEAEGKVLKVLKDHIAVKYNERGYPYYHCTVCKKSFNCRSQQYYHLGCNCRDQRKYKCHQCDKTFSIKSHLNYHIQSHSETLHHCNQCNKQFKNSFVLKKHEKLHGENSASCAKCNKTFRSNDSLKIHMLLHSKEKFTHACHICSKTYSTKSNLQQHMLKHADKKFSCILCCKRFQRNSSLKSHMKKHEKTESLVCAICNKHFSDAGALQRHSKYHEETIKFQCNFCDIITVRKDNMLRHVRNIHPEESFDSCVKILQPLSTSSKKDLTNDIINNGNNYDEVEQHPMACSNPSPRIPENKPKTVENSSVIKCIGNVEPVKVPTIVSEPSERFSKSNTEKRIINEYDPIKLYRKILTLGDDDEDDNCENGYDNDKDNSNPNFHSIKEQTNSTLLNCNNFQQTKSSYCWNNFSEMHWRKNFMNTYETDADK